MGYGFPAAIGCQAGNPDRDVICIAGDGSIQMNIQELATIFLYNIPVKVVILNNQYLGMVRQWQQLFSDRRYSSVCLNKRDDCPPDCTTPGDDCPLKVPNFESVAKAYKVYGNTVKEKDKLNSALTELLKVDGPGILDVYIPAEENVYPMVPPGAGVQKMIDASDE